MRRALVALVLAPLLVSSVFGIGALLAFPFMFGITIVLALPLFLLFARIQRLQWWHAVLAGSFCGSFFVGINTLLSFSSDADQLADSNNVLFIGLGALTGFLFWWIGIFRTASRSARTTQSWPPWARAQVCGPRHCTPTRKTPASYSEFVSDLAQQTPTPLDVSFALNAAWSRAADNA